MHLKPYTAMYLTLLLALPLAPFTSHGRWMNPQTGRFWTMDTFEGDQKDPQSLHKYLYCSGDPVNLGDASGHEYNMITLQTTTGTGNSLRTRSGTYQVRAYQRGVSIRDWNSAVSSFQGGVQGSAVYKGGAITVAAIVMAGHLAAIWQSLDPDEEESARARRELKTSVETAAQEKGQSGRILYYYGSAKRITDCYNASALFASEGAPKDGFPVGGYSSDIPPWDVTYTQTQLAQGFFGVDQGWRDVRYFIAFGDDGTWNPLPYTLNPGILHWHKYANQKGQLVPIKRICAGANLMP